MNIIFSIFLGFPIALVAIGTGWYGVCTFALYGFGRWWLVQRAKTLVLRDHGSFSVFILGLRCVLAWWTRILLFYLVPAGILTAIVLPLHAQTIAAYLVGVVGGAVLAGLLSIDAPFWKLRELKKDAEVQFTSDEIASKKIELDASIPEPEQRLSSDYWAFRMNIFNSTDQMQIASNVQVSIISVEGDLEDWRRLKLPYILPVNGRPNRYGRVDVGPKPCIVTWDLLLVYHISCLDENRTHGTNVKIAPFDLQSAYSRENGSENDRTIFLTIKIEGANVRPVTKRLTLAIPLDDPPSMTIT